MNPTRHCASFGADDVLLALVGHSYIGSYAMVPCSQAEAEADPFALDAAADPFAMEAGDGWEDDLAGRDFDLSSAPSAAEGPLRDGGVATPVLDDSRTGAAAPQEEGQGDRVSQPSGSYPRTPSERSLPQTDAALHASECGIRVVQADDGMSVGSPLADYRSSSAQGMKDAADGVITSCSCWDEVCCREIDLLCNQASAGT